VQRFSVQGASAYIKIADGCRRPCAFCAIPLIKGSAVSRPVEAIIPEGVALQLAGVRELVLIAQDTTDYGHDLGLKDGLAVLLEALVEALRLSRGKQPGVNWIRIMYAYPGYVTDRLIDVMAAYPQIVPYLDMPLQHAHPAVLRRMRRPANVDWVYRTLEKMRTAMPGLALRTTFIVGYPGETEGEFQALLDFIQEIRFDRVGAFQFSFEPGTTSEPLGDPVPPEVKQERWERLMELQQTISLERNQSWVGKTLDILVEGYGDGLSVGRTYRDAPEIDGLTIVEGELPLGELIPVRITGAMAYDLTGTVETGQVVLAEPFIRESSFR
jgi:ribosomal protein S12 methylthiotransferase